MHTTSYDGDIHFIHNGDFSDDVIINMPAAKADMTLHHTDNTASITVPYDALEYLVVTKVSSDLISGLEDATSMKDIFKALGVQTDRKDPGDIARLGFVRALAALDNPDNLLRRREQTLQNIIDQAKELLK